jgi:hypothetical protein
MNVTKYWEQNQGFHNIWRLSIYGCLVIFDKGLGLGGDEIQHATVQYVEGGHHS